MDLSRPVVADAFHQTFQMDDPEGKHAFCTVGASSCEALQELYPGVKFGIGPAIENGFYYDIDPGDNKITSDDFAKSKPRCSNSQSRTSRLCEPHLKADALKLFGDRNEEYKCELISELEDGQYHTTPKVRSPTSARGPHIRRQRLSRLRKS